MLLSLSPLPSSSTPLPSERPSQPYMLARPIPAFYILQRVIYGTVSMSKQAKANSPGESPQMHTESSPQCHTHSSASQRRHEAPSPPNSQRFHGPGRRTWSPALNMEMLWKQNLNIYIRCLLEKRRGYAPSFHSGRRAACVSCALGRGGEAEEGGSGREQVCADRSEATF